MLTTLKQIILGLRKQWGINDYDINMAILQTIIDFCEQHDELGFSNVTINDVYSKDVKLGGVCTATKYSSEIQISPDCVEYVEAILEGKRDEILVDLFTIPVHEYRHSYQHLMCLPIIYVKYTEAGDNVDAYYNHPTEVEAYAYQEKLADETMQYLIDNLEKNYKSDHMFEGRFCTKYNFPKDPSKEVEREDWEYEMMYDDMMYDEEEYEF